jgi:hypothetical protein
MSEIISLAQFLSKNTRPLFNVEWFRSLFKWKRK